MPRSAHPWRNHPDQAQHVRYDKKCTMVVSREEEKAIRARAQQEGNISISAFLRKHFPPELLLPPATDN